MRALRMHAACAPWSTPTERHSVLRLPERSVGKMSGQACPASSTQLGSACFSSPWKQNATCGHARVHDGVSCCRRAKPGRTARLWRGWPLLRDGAACRRTLTRSPISLATWNTARYCSQSYCRGAGSTCPHHTFTTTPQTPRCCSALSPARTACGGACSSQLGVSSCSSVQGNRALRQPGQLGEASSWLSPLAAGSRPRRPHRKGSRTAVPSVLRPGPAAGAPEALSASEASASPQVDSELRAAASPRPRAWLFLEQGLALWSCGPPARERCSGRAARAPQHSLRPVRAPQPAGRAVR